MNNGLIPDGAWVLVEVQGSITYSRNPLCYEEERKGYCDNPDLSWLEQNAFGPMDHGGEVKVALLRPGMQPASNSGMSLHGTDGTASGATGRLLQFNSAGPLSLWTRRLELNSLAGSPTFPERRWPVYEIDGEQHFTVKVVPTPLKVEGPTATRPGEAATFNATIVGPFQFRSPPRTAEPIVWRFYPNDTLPEPDRSLGGNIIASCWNEQACTYVPGQSGRMGVAGYVEANYVTVRGPVVRLRTEEPELVVECKEKAGGRSGVVTRGETMECTTRTEPVGGRIEVEEWWFEGVDATGAPYRYPTADDPPVTDASWSGQMAISGTVHVRARVNSGAAVTKQATVTVEPRNWVNQPVPYRIRRISFEDFPGNLAPQRYPRSESDLGHMLAGGIYLSAQDQIFTFVRDEGPNHFLAFLNRVPVELDFGVFLHPELVAEGEFYRRQAQSRSTAQPPRCNGSDFPNFVQMILAHEGDPMTPHSHTGVFYKEFVSLAGPAVEDLVASDDALGKLSELVQNRISPIMEQVQAIEKSMVDSAYKVPFRCQFNFRR